MHQRRQYRRSPSFSHNDSGAFWVSELCMAEWLSGRGRRGRRDRMAGEKGNKKGK